MRGLGLALCVAVLFPALVATGSVADASASGSLASTTAVPTAQGPALRTASVVFEPFIDHSYAHRDGSGVLRADDSGGVESAAVAIQPAAGRQLTKGRLALTPGVTNQPYVETGDTFCTTTAQSFRSGYLDVLDVEYDASGRLTSVAADLSLDCDARVRTAEVRLASTVPYASVLAPPRASEFAYPGTEASAATTFTNDGTASVTPGAATLGTFSSNSTSAERPGISEDGCANRTLAPGDACTVMVSSPPGSVEVRLPVPALDALAARAAPGPVITSNVDVVQRDRPAAVSRLNATGAVDGNAVSWTHTDADHSAYAYSIERRTGNGSWTTLDSSFEGEQYADTSAPAAVASSYRVTPRGDAGADITGSALSPPATPVRAWAPPAGARTYSSVDGGPITGAEGVRTSAASYPLTLRANGLERMRIGFRGYRVWQEGRFATGSAAGDLYACLIEQPSASGFPTCTQLAGVLTVRRVVLRADGTPAEMAATFSGSGNVDGATRTVQSIVVINSTPAGLPSYLSASLAPKDQLPPYAQTDSWDGELSIPQVHGQADDFGVVLRNLGGAPVTVSKATATPRPPGGISDKNNWSVSPACSGASISSEGSCSTRVHFVADWYGDSESFVTWTGSSGQDARLLVTGNRPVNTAPVLALHTFVASPGGPVSVGLSGSDHLNVPLTFYCRWDDSAWRTCSSEESSGGLAEGTHTLTAYAQTPDHRVSNWESATALVDRTGPVTRIARPGADASVLTGSARVSWESTDTAGSGVKFTQSRHRSAGPGTTYGAYVTGPYSYTGSTTTTPGAGTEQCWSARGFDVAGNTGDWSAERCLTAPLDDRMLAGRGFVRRTSSYAINRSVSVSSRAGATLTLARARARQVGVVVTTCRGCGSVGVYFGGARIGTVGTNGVSHAKVVRWLPKFSATRTGVLQLRSLGRQRVNIDGVLIKHR